MISEAKCAVVTLPDCPSSLSPSILPDTYFNIVINFIVIVILIIITMISNKYVANTITTITDLFSLQEKNTPDANFYIVINSIVISSSTLQYSPLFWYYAFLVQHYLHRDNLYIR